MQKSIITLEDVKKMDENKIKLEIGKHSKFLQDELGMSKQDASNFVASLLNLGSVLQK